MRGGLSKFTRGCGCQHLSFADPMYVVLGSQNKEESYRGCQPLHLSNAAIPPVIQVQLE